MDENTAWNCFQHTGNISDYLIYSQCKHNHEEMQMREDLDANRNQGPGDSGEMRG
ncbi:hypothetical protein CAGA_21170 [Caproiciproducens galactitolivorans]|jgi:hypothetical protein|uniref:YqzL-like protein n=1 Tax=Caproiciproducens galactitolivorans TaxID=642589 RepID=A0A4Z0XWC6_9FIRM|nr:hypothetical protein CAGA_21170 [Caproiciproducens galactitolivorans]